jgi:hypothetical protein
MLTETIEATLADMGVTLSATLVRDDFDGFDNRSGQSVWAVTIVRNGESFQTEYSMGAAHRHYQNNKPIRLKSYHLTHFDCAQYNRTKPDNPTLADVLYCLSADAAGIEDGIAFENWAADYGYSVDSRKAEASYNACRDEYFGLLRLFGYEGLRELHELFQDY